MRFVSLDIETYLIRPGCVTPKLVCVTLYEVTPDGAKRTLLDDVTGAAAAWALLADPEVTVIGHHVFYDLAVLAADEPRMLPTIFAALDAGRVRCTKIRQMMIDNASGELKYIEDEETGDMKAQDYSLQRLVYRHLKRYAPKGKSCGGCVGGHEKTCFSALCLGCCPAQCEASFRLRYGLLHKQKIPLAEWPELASKYAQDDAEDTYKVFMSQEAIVAPEGIPGEVHQVQAAWALYLTSAWGLRTDRAAVEKLRADLTVELARVGEICKKHKLVREDNTRDMEAIRARVQVEYARLGEPVPATEGDNVATDKFTLKHTKHEGLVSVAEYVHVGKLLSTYVPVLERGTETPIHTSYNPILETFRTSSSKPNVQQPPRKGDVRGCFVPRRGSVFVTCDYDTLEMRTLAQTCVDLFGYSTMRDALVADQDLHLALAADILKISYAEAKARYDADDPILLDTRQAVKPANFGFPGGMGAKAFLEYALHSYDVEVSLDMALELHASFRNRWQMAPYFAFCANLAGEDVADRVIFPRSKQVRGRVPYTAVCNGFFQELAARGAKEALWHVVRECYLPNEHGLYGCRPVLFMHDEIMIECRRDASDLASRTAASRAAARLSEVMISTMQRWLPDVPVKATAVMMPKWLKGAKPKRDAAGNLAPVRPVVDGKKTSWVLA